MFMKSTIESQPKRKKVISKIVEIAIKRIWDKYPDCPPIKVVEIERAIGISPYTIINYLAKDGTIAVPSIPKGQTTKDWVKSIKTPKPSKKADKIWSLVQSEGQRYQRRPPFPTPGDQSKTTRKKIEPRVIQQQLRDVKIISRAVDYNTKTKPIEPLNESLAIFPAALFPVPSSSPEQDRTTVEAMLIRSNYWDGTSRQKISPDLVGISEGLLQQTKTLCELESQFLSNLAAAYLEDVDIKSVSPLTNLIEGNFSNSPGIQILRSWCTAAPEPNFFRLDLGVDEDKLFVCEVNLISCGTPPAMLYREAQTAITQQRQVIPATNGALEYFFDVLTEKPNPTVTIVGTTPKTPSQKLYEKSHTDMARILTDFGVKASCYRLLDLITDKNDIREPNGNDIKTVYWFGDPISPDGNSELNSKQGKALLEQYKDGKIEFLPSPVFALSDNKAVDALVWDDRFNDLVPDGLRDFVPQTEVVSSISEMCKKAIGQDGAWKQFVLKPTISTGGAAGVVIGSEKPRGTFLSALNTALTIPGSAIIQELKLSSKIPLRTFENGRWRAKGYYPRLEPTAVIKDGKTEVIDLFFTGRPETRKVGGASNCVMSTVMINKEKNI